MAKPGIYGFTCLTFEKIGATSRKLGEFTPVSISGEGRFRDGNFYITFYDENGAQRLVKNDTQITTMYPGIENDSDVKDAAVMFAYKKGVGWYIADDYALGNYAYLMNDFVINPGEGFQIYADGSAFTAGVQIDLPNALAPATEE